MGIKRMCVEKLKKNPNSKLFIQKQIERSNLELHIYQFSFICDPSLTAGKLLRIHINLFSSLPIILKLCVRKNP
jgi:hypothetical protein